MGSNTSKPTRQATYKTAVASSSSDDDELVYKLQHLLGTTSTANDDDDDDDDEGQATELNPISINNLNKWEESLLADPKNQLALNCFTGNDITKIIANTSKMNQNNVDLFNVTVKFEGGPITNQKSSGRCWLFASTNVFKEFMKNKYNLDSFEFSQNYLFFHDKLQKCNWFLNRILDSYDEDLDSRFVQFLLQLPENDGGQWDMVQNLLTTVGLVPKSLYPDSASSISSSRLNYFINNKLREFALILRKLKSDEKATEIKEVKESMLKEIYDILALTLGVPPKPTDEITWEYKDKFGNFHLIKTTPLNFYKDLLGFPAENYFSLIHDPRNTEGLYTVDRLGNIEGGKPIEYVNTSINNLKEAAIAMLQANEPVFFGSDVGKFEDTTIGLLDVESWDYQLGFGSGMNLSKKQRLLSGSSQMTHAMVLTGVHLIDGKPVRFRVENSWGEYGEHKGYFVMSDKWFDEYVLQIVTCEKYTKKHLTNLWKGKDYSVLPYYDPMGSLA
ncbi:hypothetical protein CANARDRAFT_231713 [[Candida] arabinofermentans NRRL YB-2248]|uniref:Cysteine proteinase 1, mitochondrial n=1 Tax=[Candida] arabinofermentans NRRL YB-2248 TaxID=983967 RepID=A0A1E4T3J3_9ASCO|nr:hypothetical protein CANARDRAFT_231713 [[Candida] arabinofermentans NRRL YB-2248]